MDILFDLLSVGIGTKQIEKINLASLSNLSIADWVNIREKSIKQGVEAIALDGLNGLLSEYGSSLCCNIPSLDWQTFYLEWIGRLMLTEKENKAQEIVLKQMAALWVKEGCKVMIMKGLANSLWYNHPYHRGTGDIDCYLFDDYPKGNEIARKAGATVDDGWYKHSQIIYKGEIFENHHFFVLTRNGSKSKRLNQELVQALQIQSWDHYPQSDVLLPPAQFNAMFLTYHACSHFLSEGLRMKQLLDWAMFIQHEQNNIDWTSFYDFCDRYNFRRFVDAITSICIDELSVNVVNKDIITDSPYKEKMAHSILYDNDYVFGTNDGALYKRFHVIKNLFVYRWRYRDIYQQPIWKQLWWYISGFLLHTEKGCP